MKSPEGIKKKRIINDVDKTVTYIENGTRVVKPIRQEVHNKYEPRAGTGPEKVEVKEYETKDFTERVAEKVMAKIEDRIVERILEKLG